MNEFHAYLLYKAIKLHFTSVKYDYKKFNGKMKGNSAFHQKEFESKNTKFLYTHLANHKDPEGFLVANLVINPKAFITELNASGNAVYESYRLRKTQMYYILQNELEKYTIPELKSLNDSCIPNIIQGYISGELTPESVVLIDCCINKLSEWVKSSHPVVKSASLTLLKYKLLIDVDAQKLKKAFAEAYKYT